MVDDARRVVDDRAACEDERQKRGENQMPIQDPPKAGEVKASFTTPGAAKRALERLTDRGVDASSIRLTDDAVRRLREVKCHTTADRRAMELALRAVTVGVVAGLVIGLVLGLLVWAALDVMLLAALLPLGLVGAGAGGAVGGVYRWRDNHAWSKLLGVPDLDAPMDLTVVVRPADDTQRAAAREVLGEHADDVAG